MREEKETFGFAEGQELTQQQVSKIFNFTFLFTFHGDEYF